MYNNLPFRKHIKYYLALLLFFSVFCVFVYAQTSPVTNILETCPIQSYQTKADYTQAILRNFTVSTKDFVLKNESSTRNLSALIGVYCASVLSAGQYYDGDLLYSSRQSAFVYLLCVNNSSDFSKFFTRQSDLKSEFSSNFSGYFKVSDFNKLGFPVNKNEKYLAYLYVDDLFNNLIAEYFDIKQANIYGLLTDESEKVKFEKQASLFSSLYFQGIEVCNTSPNPNVAGVFPKTCKYLTQYIKSAGKMFKSLNIMDTKKMLADYEELKKANTKNPDFCSSAEVLKGDYQIMLCAFWGDLSEKKLNPFVNLLYNELFYYNLFVEYFGMRLQKEPYLLSDTTMNKGVGTIPEQQAARANQMKAELGFSKDALSLSLRMLRNSYTSFPIHIGLLMYRESLQDFGKALAPLATPVYTLYDKFRNVQCIAP